MRARTRMLAELVTAEGRIDPAAWRTAHADRTPVARCACGGPVLTDPEAPEYVVFYGVRWYAMRCVSCGKDTETPATRVLQTEVRRPSLAHSAAVLARERVLTGDR
jgi:hypothetical protein